MCFKMEWNAVVCLCFLIGIVKATQVDLNSEWKPNLGWVITCSWKLFSNDTLQSVRLYDDERQFMIYRPEVDGEKRSELFHRPEDMLLVQCTESVPRGLVGTCVLTLEPNQPPSKDASFSCEVSGERPKFRMEKKSLVINELVLPSDALVEMQSTNVDTGRVMLNCTASGLPAPHLTWTIGEQKIPSDFTGSFWNTTSKLVNVWSVVSYSSSNSDQAVCTPETVKDGVTTKGEPALYFNSSYGLKGIKSIVFTLLIKLLMLR